MSATVRTVDVAILGAGTAGLNARRGAETEGASAVMVDPGPYGTTCARVGCMPSKLLIAPAEAVHKASLGEQFGFSATVTVDGARVMDRVRRERDRFVGFVSEDIEEHRQAGRLIPAYGRIVDHNTIQAGEVTVKARSIVIATGSSPWTPPPFRHLSSQVMLDNEGLFNLTDLPESVLVVGPGVIGLELGQALHRLGVRTTIVGIGGIIGPFQDPKIRAAATSIFQSELDLQVDYVLHSIEEVEGVGVRVRFTADDGTERDETYARVLMAAGRRPNTRGFGLEELGYQPDALGRLSCDPQTTQVGDSNLFIAGDASNHRPLLHEASDDGRIAGANAARFPDITAVSRRTALAVVFTDPQMAIVGDSWKLHNCTDHRVGEVSYHNQGRARVMLENRGLVRIYGSRVDGRIRGAEMLGPDVEHTGHLLAWAIQAGLTVEQVLEMPFYHPTVEEGIRTALRDLRKNLRHERPRGTHCDEFQSGT